MSTSVQRNTYRLLTSRNQDAIVYVGENGKGQPQMASVLDPSVLAQRCGGDIEGHVVRIRRTIPRPFSRVIVVKGAT
jgi:hypothetical protein